MRIRTLFIITLAMSGPAASAVPATWTLTDDRFRQKSVRLESITDGQFNFATADGPFALKSEKFLSLERPIGNVNASGQFALHIAGGDTLFGSPGGVKDGRLTWKTDAFGELRVKLSDCRALVRRDAAAPVDQIDDKRVEDVVGFSNGDAQKGFIADVDAEQIVLDIGDSRIPREIASIHYILFASPARAAAGDESAIRVRLVDGSALTASTVRTRNDGLIMTVRDGDEREVPLDALAALEHLNGPVAWVSVRMPVSIEQTNFVIEHPPSFPTRMNRTVDGKPIRFGKTTYSRGIGVHARSVIVFNVDPAYPWFRTQYAIDPDQPRTDKADVTVRIKADDKILHEVAHFRGGHLSPVVLVDLSGARQLTLEVDFGANAESQDRFNWIESAYLKHKPAADDPPAATSGPATNPAPATTPSSGPATKPTTGPSAIPVLPMRPLPIPIPIPSTAPAPIEPGRPEKPAKAIQPVDPIEPATMPSPIILPEVPSLIDPPTRPEAEPKRRRSTNPSNMGD